MKARALKVCLKGMLLCFTDTTIAEMVKEQTDPEEFRERIQVEQGACIKTALMMISNWNVPPFETLNKLMQSLLCCGSHLAVFASDSAVIGD